MGLLKPIRNQAKKALANRVATKSAPQSAKKIDLKTVRRAAVVRPNARIGNTLFLLPLLDALAVLRAEPWVDLVMGNRALAEDLFAAHPAVRSIVGIPRLGRMTPAALAAGFKVLRHPDLDLILDPTTHSISSRVVVAMSRSRYRVGFLGDGQWLNLSHGVAVPTTKTPAWRLPLALLTACAAGIDADQHRNMRLTLSAMELAEGGRLLEAAGLAATRGSGRPLVGFFCGARGAKELPTLWWQQWAAAFLDHREVTLVQILPGANAPPLAAQIPTIQAASLRRLASAMAHLDLFVSCDTGPMHLAAATATPVSALFSHTDPAVFGPQSASDQVVWVGDSSIEQIVAGQVRQLRSAPARPAV